MTINILFRSILLLGAFADVALAAEKAAPPQSLAKLLECKALSDPAARLACYDEQTSAIEAATQRKDLLVLNKDDVKRTRRSLFGFSLPKLPLLGDEDDKDDSNRVDEIEDKLASVRSQGYGLWQVKLGDGSTWQTTDAMTFTPKAGMSITIKRGVLGSFKGSINNWKPPVKIKRVE